MTIVEKGCGHSRVQISRGCGDGPGLRRDDDEFVATIASNRQHLVVDLGDGVDATQPHGGGELLAQNVERLGDAGLAAGAEAVGIGAADHAGLRAERERAHDVHAGADAAVEHDLEL